MGHRYGRNAPGGVMERDTVHTYATVLMSCKFNVIFDSGIFKKSVLSNLSKPCFPNL